MEKPEIIYGGYQRVLQKEVFDTEKLERVYPIYITTRDKVEFWEMIKKLYQYMKKLYLYKNYPKEIKLTLFYDNPCRLTVTFANNEITLWSEDAEIQTKAMKTFKFWEDIQKYYKKSISDVNKKLEYEQTRLEAIKKEAEIKEQRRLKRLQNNPDSIEARRRKAYRHLKRLGYSLHKYRNKHNFSNEDMGLYKITDSQGKIIIGANFDATIEDVESFYMEKDDERDNNTTWGWNQAYYNRYPHSAKREELAKNILLKYKIEIEIDCVSVYNYNYRCYRLKNMRGSKYIKKKDLFLNLQRKNGDYGFTLPEVEKICSALESIPKCKAIYMIQDWILENI